MPKTSHRWTAAEIALIDQYFREIGKVDLLTPDQEKEFAANIRDGDMVAFEQLIKGNLRFVTIVARQYCGEGLFLGDLINEGNVGLVQAVQSLTKMSYKGRFIVYAVKWIRNRVLLALTQQAYAVLHPLNQRASIKEVMVICSNLEQKYQRMPTIEELNEVMMITDDELVQVFLWKNKKAIVSLAREKSELIEVLEQKNIETPCAGLTREFFKKDIQCLLPSLEADVITLYFGLNGEHAMTLEEIGEKFNLTRGRVHQIKEKAIRRLRQTSRSKALKPYLE